MNYVDKNVKEIANNNTIGILICKKENKFVIEYCSDDRIAVREYELVWYNNFGEVMKKILVLCIMCLLLCGCNNPTTRVNENNSIDCNKKDELLEKGALM